MLTEPAALTLSIAVHTSTCTGTPVYRTTPSYGKCFENYCNPVESHLSTVHQYLSASSFHQSRYADGPLISGLEEV